MSAAHPCKSAWWNGQDRKDSGSRPAQTDPLRPCWQRAADYLQPWSDEIHAFLPEEAEHGREKAWPWHKKLVCPESIALAGGRKAGSAPAAASCSPPVRPMPSTLRPA